LPAADDEKRWRAFFQKYRAETGPTDKRLPLGLLAALSLRTNYPMGCRCADERRCHRSILRELLEKHAAELA
jgi:uncharacterized protein YeaO (DUF488 family)